MTLRDQIKDALDDVAPPAPTLERRVTAFVFADKRDRKMLLGGRRGALSTNGFRGMAALVAAGLVVALLAGIAIGGRLGRDLGNAESPQRYTIDQSEVHRLESKPIVLPQLEPGAACPLSPDVDQVGQRYSVLRGGPVYIFDIWLEGSTKLGDWNAAGLYYTARQPGLVLVRAEDLQTGEPFVFTQYPNSKTPALAMGPLQGTDRMYDQNMQLHPEAVLPDPWHQQPNHQLIVMFAIPRSTLCWGIQFDGPGFTQTWIDGWDSAASKP